MTYLSQRELEEVGFKHLGINVKLSNKASIYNPENISFDDNCRVDDFCILSAGSGGVHIGKYVHIAAYSSLIGNEEIFLDDFSGLSSRVSVYSSNDDYSGDYMAHPTIPSEFRNVDSKPVFIGRHVIVGSGSIILPGANLKDGVSIGALSLVNGRYEYKEFTIYAGVPAKYIKKRSTKLLELERQFLFLKDY